jgi:DNA primase
MINSPIDEIKNRINIVDLIKDYVKLEKSGSNYRAICPFHSEKTPSFFVNQARQIWHCFGSCNEGGDIFKFIMKIEGFEFADALRILAAKAGVELKKQDPIIKSKRQRIYEICEWSARFFQLQMQTKNGSMVKEYLSKRGINESSIEEWRIGYAPEGWSSLFFFLNEKGYSGKEIVSAGLAIEKNDFSGYFDRFRKRIIFPIFDFNLQPVGFGGRIFNSKNEKEAKYMNTPNTILYDKSKILYGLHRARTPIRKEDNCILVEGYTDVITSCQSGIDNVVAASGTALTRDQLSLIKRYTDNITTAFDMDDAGGSATSKSIDLALSMGFDVRVALMNDGLDPADMILNNPESWKESIKKSISIMDFYFKKAFSKIDSSIPENKKKIGFILVPEIAKIPNNIEKDYWVQKLADKLEVKEESIRKEIDKISPETKDREDVVIENNNKKDRKTLLEERLLMFIAKKPSLIDSIEEVNDIFKKDIKLIESLKLGEKDATSEDKERIGTLLMKAEIECDDLDIDCEFSQCLSDWRFITLKNKLMEISEKIRKAEKENNSIELEKLLKEFSFISQKLNSKI